MERSYNVPLRKSFRHSAKHKKTPKAVRAVREFLKKHMKAEKIRLGMHLNEHLWKHGIKNPPHHVKVHALKEDDVVKAELEGFEFKEAVKAEKKKKEAPTMKDKLAAKLGIKEAPKEEKKEEVKKE
nr:60S ribosomal protein L31 [Nanoarchaeota archaeon]